MHPNFDNSTELVQYTSANAMASAYETQAPIIHKAIADLKAACAVLKVAFDDSYFGVDVRHNGKDLYSYREAPEQIADDLLNRLKVDAWKCIFAKMNIRKVMSSKAKEELDGKLDYEHHAEFPDVTPRIG